MCFLSDVRTGPFFSICRDTVAFTGSAGFSGQLLSFGAAFSSFNFSPSGVSSLCKLALLQQLFNFFVYLVLNLNWNAAPPLLRDPHVILHFAFLGTYFKNGFFTTFILFIYSTLTSFYWLRNFLAESN